MRVFYLFIYFILFLFLCHFVVIFGRPTTVLCYSCFITIYLCAIVARAVLQGAVS